MQGWSPDFVSKLASDVLEEGLADSFVTVSGDESLRLARALAREEGIFCGISSGATLAGALEIAKTAPEGSVIVCMLPDTGERYLSTSLFDDVDVDMSSAEEAISQSTPNYRFDVSPSVKRETPSAPVTPAPSEAIALVEEIVGDPTAPVVMFALEWCEFCWSVRKFFDELGITYRSVNLDSIGYQEDDLGGALRAALRERVNVPTIPQIFVAGEHVGGCTETFDAYNNGELGKRLERAAVAFDHEKSVNAYDFLPSWLVPRAVA
jgi:cysteine synthase A